MKYTKDEIAANRAQWIKYLREPGREKYKFGLFDLNNRKAHCCLGHYCAMKGLPQAVRGAYGEYDGACGILPKSLALSLDIDAVGSFKEPVVIGAGTFVALAEVNDDSDLTMAEISDVIEEQFNRDNLANFGSDE